MILRMLAVLQRLPEKPDWFVFLCPTPESARLHSQVLAVLLPQEAKFSGRTAILKGKKISVVAASDKVFIPITIPYVIELFGWDSALPTTEAAAWIQRSSQLFSR